MNKSIINIMFTPQARRRAVEKSTPQSTPANASITPRTAIQQLTRGPSLMNEEIARRMKQINPSSDVRRLFESPGHQLGVGMRAEDQWSPTVTFRGGEADTPPSLLDAITGGSASRSQSAVRSSPRDPMLSLTPSYRGKEIARLAARIDEVEARQQQGTMPISIAAAARDAFRAREERTPGISQDENRESTTMGASLPGSAVARNIPVPVASWVDYSTNENIATSAIVPTSALGGPVVAAAPSLSGTPAPAVAAPIDGYGAADPSYIPKGRNLPGYIANPNGQLVGDANSTYLMGGADASQMGNNDIFAARAERLRLKRPPTDDMWWLKNPLKMDDVDVKMARDAQRASEPNEEHIKRQRVYAERELMRTPRYRLYAGSDHVAQEILSHRNY